jgi:hypothetical protein
MGWVDLKKQTKRCHCFRRPILWPWVRIAAGSVWECKRCTKRWIVGGLGWRYWSDDVELWSD